MKRILIVSIFSLCALLSKAQLPSFPYQGNSSTGFGQNSIIGSKIGFLFQTNFTDTLTANLYQVSGSIVGFLKNIAGVQIRCGNDIYIRSNNLQQWIKFATGTISTSYWGLTGNSGTNPASDFIGTTDNVGMKFMTNNQRRITIGANGGIGLGTGEDYGTAGWLFQSNGTSPPTWVNPSTFANIYNSDGTLTASRTVNADSKNLQIVNINQLQISSAGSSEIVMNGGELEVRAQTHLELDGIDSTTLLNLTNLTTQDRIIGQRTSSNRLGYLTLGTNLSMSGGVINAAGSGLSGSGTTNYIPKWSSSTALWNSVMYDDGTNIGIGTITPSEKLDVLGDIKYSGEISNVDTITSSTGRIYTNLRPINYGTSYGARGVQMGYNSGYGLFNVNASGRPNVVANLFMYNTDNGGGRINTSEASFRLGFETHYEMLGGKNYFEFHGTAPEVTTSTGTSYRPFSVYAGKDTTADSFIQSLVPSIEFFSGNANTGSYFSANGTKSSGAWNHKFNSPNNVSGVLFQGTGSDAVTYMDAVGSSPQLILRDWSNISFTSSGSKLSYISSTNELSNVRVSSTLKKNRVGATDSIMFEYTSGAGDYKSGLITNYGTGEIQHFAQSGGYFQTFWHSNAQAFRTITGGIAGSSSASGSLTISSTSHATKGNILFGTSAYDEVNNRLGIGTTSPTAKLQSTSTGEQFRTDYGGGVFNSYTTSSIGGLTISGNAGQTANFYANTWTVGSWAGAATINAASGGAGNSNRAGINLIIGSGQSTGNGVGGNTIFQYTPAGGSGTSVNAYTTAMTILGTNGDVGIGTTSPTAKLHLIASTTAANTASLKINEGSRQTTPEDGTINYVANNLEFVETSTVYTLAKTLTATVELDFPDTAAGTASDLTIEVTGASSGDAVYIAVDNASVTSDNIGFWGWVSASNTVTIRFNNNNLVSAVDPASGTFRAVVTKY